MTKENSDKFGCWHITNLNKNDHKNKNEKATKRARVYCTAFSHTTAQKTFCHYTHNMPCSNWIRRLSQNWLVSGWVAFVIGSDRTTESCIHFLIHLSIRLFMHFHSTQPYIQIFISNRNFQVDLVVFDKPNLIYSKNSKKLFYRIVLRFLIMIWWTCEKWKENQWSFTIINNFLPQKF